MSAYLSHGTVTLPDGRQVIGHLEYWYEWDTNALVEIDNSGWIEWVETGERLTADEANQEIELNCNLWGWVFAKLPAELDLGPPD